MTIALDDDAKVRRYLALPLKYVNRLGGVQWSYLADRIAFPNGQVAMEHGPLAEFIEGFASQHEPISFGLMLHLAMMSNPDCSLLSYRAEYVRLRDAFRAAGCHWRNAGALAGMICREVPAAIDAPSPQAICDRLRDRHSPPSLIAAMLNGLTSQAEEPPYTFNDFDLLVSRSLADLPAEEVTHWLMFGRGSMGDAGRKLADERPQRWTPSGVIEELLKRPRLAGAAPYLDQMISALSIPAPRRRLETLPLGGYSDVITRGTPDRLLPSQHALDEIEFLRRYSENELLYFRREDPPSQPKRDLAIVLDQGVRTWGDVRLILVAASLALAKNASTAGRRCLLWCTSRRRPFEQPLAAPIAAIGESLEESDLTPNPSETLEAALEQESASPLDVFLLTHPRNIRDDDVGVAARRLGAEGRLFALSVDAHGHAEVAEFRRGRPVRLKSFRIEFQAAETIHRQGVPAASGWTGQVEQVGWPFRFGPTTPVQLFDFDDSGEKIIALWGESMLTMWDLKGGGSEMLPRPATQAKWSHLLGIRGGFALLGRDGTSTLVAQYDIEHRSCKLHRLDLQGVVYEPEFDPAQHVLSLAADGNATISATIDCRTGVIENLEKPATSPLNIVVSNAPVSRKRRLIRMENETALQSMRLPAYSYDPANGNLHVFDGQNLAICMYRSDGKTLAQLGFRPEKADLRGGTFAMAGSFSDGSRHVLSFVVPEGAFLAAFRLWTTSNAGEAFRLSNDGQSIAISDGIHFNVQSASQGPQFRMAVRSRGMADRARLWVGHQGMLIACGRRTQVAHLLDWSQGPLTVVTEVARATIKKLEPGQFRHSRIAAFIAEGDPTPACDCGPKDFPETGPNRWRSFFRSGTSVILLDRYSEAAVLNSLGNTAFMFFANGDSWTAWLPDGTRHGVGSMHQWPNSKDALRRMGEALRQACEARA